MTKNKFCIQNGGKGLDFFFSFNIPSQNYDLFLMSKPLLEDMKIGYILLNGIWMELNLLLHQVTKP